MGKRIRLSYFFVTLYYITIEGGYSMDKEDKEMNRTAAAEQKMDENKTVNDRESVAPDAVKKKSSRKKTNKTWEAFGKSKGCFIINDPKFLL